MADTRPTTKTELLERIEPSWTRFHNYLKSLTPEQLDGPKDAVGWTVKDHLTHLMTWEDGFNGLLNGRARWDQMNVGKDLWDETMRTRQFDKINATIQQQHSKKSAAEIMKELEAIHERLMAKIKSLSEDEIRQVPSHFHTESPGSTPLVSMIPGDTYEHFDEHGDWIRKIIEGK